jgi:hypothetical protein
MLKFLRRYTASSRSTTKTPPAAMSLGLAVLPTALTGFVLAASPAGAAPAQGADKVLHSFVATDGSYPSDIASDNNGNLFGVAEFNGANNFGTIFELSERNGKKTFRTIWTFTGLKDGSNPTSISVDSAGNLYVTEPVGAKSTGEIAQFVPDGAGGWKLGNPYNFKAAPGQSALPSKVVVDASGNVFGLGGLHIYELSPTAKGWKYTALYTFMVNLPRNTQPGKKVQGNPDAQGSAQMSSVALGRNGDVYAVDEFGTNNFGAVFRLHMGGNGWTRQDIYTFTGGTDSGQPAPSLLLDRAGNVFGVTTLNEAIFELSPPSKGLSPQTPWNFAVVHPSPRGPDGYGAAGLVFDRSGNLYGVAGVDGDPQCDCGLVFKLAPNPSGPWTETVLSTFTGQPDGYGPVGDLVLDKNARAFGVTIRGGAADDGTVFSVKQ